MAEGPTLHLEPHCAPCHNYLSGNKEQIRTVWLVPTVIKQDGGMFRITWRCSLGDTCECGGCIYAHAK